MGGGWGVPVLPPGGVPMWWQIQIQMARTLSRSLWASWSKSLTSSSRPLLTVTCEQKEQSALEPRECGNLTSAPCGQSLFPQAGSWSRAQEGRGCQGVNVLAS